MPNLFGHDILLACCVVLAVIPELASCTGVFKTEPTFDTVTLDVLWQTSNVESLGNEYIFVTPDHYWKHFGPQIYSIDGDLVWNGNGSIEFGGQDLHVCDFQGRTGVNLCLNEKLYDRNSGHHGVHLVYDDTYAVIAEFNGTGGLHNMPNEHEWTMLRGGESYLQIVYERQITDLRPYCGDVEGVISDGCFQEISVASREPLFRWCYLGHSGELWHSQVFFEIDSGRSHCTKAQMQANTTSSEAGRGSGHHPWDFMHINSVDKNVEGDYLISLRHFDSIFKIAGPNNTRGQKPGSIVWHLGGRLNDFTMTDFTFSKQHDARFLSTSSSEEIISFFDNSYAGGSKSTSDRSSAKIVSVNNKTMTAALKAEYYSPEGRLSRAQGSAQLLENGHVFTGWGMEPYMTEFVEDGTIIFHAQLRSPKGYPQRHLFNYRARRYPWVGKPSWNPKLVGYCMSCTTGVNSPLVAYVSWNGATEVRGWRFYTGNSKQGPWRYIKTVKKAGFETMVLLSSQGDSSQLVPRIIRVEALDSTGELLGTEMSYVFIPENNLWTRLHCNSVECSDHFDYNAHPSKWKTCKLQRFPTGFWICFFTLLSLEVLIAMYHSLSHIGYDEVKLEEGVTIVLPPSRHSIKSWFSLKSSWKEHEQVPSLEDGEHIKLAEESFK